MPSRPQREQRGARACVPKRNRRNYVVGRNDLPLIDAIADAFLGNPFDDKVAAERRALVDRLQPEVIGELLSTLWSNPMANLHRLVAVGVLSGEKSPYRDVLALPPSPTHAQRDAAQRCRPIVHALLRGGRAVEAIAGTSKVAKSLRARTWQVTFGERASVLFSPDLLRNCSVLILGETGVGKELIASAIAAGALSKGAGADEPTFVAENLASLPLSTIGSELLGHEKGAFTDAKKQHQGKLEQAGTGTLFLDEIGDLPAPFQVALLRALESRRFMRVGGTKPVEFNARLVSATWKPLLEAGGAQSIRSDFLYRIASVVIDVPPLRERREDIIEIASALGRPRGMTLGSRDEEELRRLAETYDWPGNVRELRNWVENRYAGMPERTAATRRAPTAEEATQLPRRLLEGYFKRRELEHWYARLVLKQVGGVKADAARRLQVSPKTLNAMLDGERSVS